MRCNLRLGCGKVAHFKQDGKPSEAACGDRSRCLSHSSQLLPAFLPTAQLPHALQAPAERLSETALAQMVLMSNSFRFTGRQLQNLHCHAIAHAVACCKGLLRTGPKGNRLTALFEIMSRVNHSCLPNARMVGDGHPAKLVTTKSVAPQDFRPSCCRLFGFVEMGLGDCLKARPVLNDSTMARILESDAVCYF